MEIRPKRYTQDILSCAIAQKLSQSKRLGGKVQWYILRYTRQRWVYLSITQYISVYIGDFWNLKSPRKSRGLSRGLSLRRRSHPGTYPGTFTERYNMIYFYIKSIYWDILSSTWYILRCAQAYLHKLYGLVYTKIYFYTKTYLVQPNINWDIPWHTNHRPGYNTEYVQDFEEHIVMQWCRSLWVPLRGWTLRWSLRGTLRGALILMSFLIDRMLQAWKAQSIRYRLDSSGAEQYPASPCSGRCLDNLWVRGMGVRVFQGHYACQMLSL